MLLVTRNKFTHKNHLLLLLSEGDIKISCMYERVNINCAEVNSTRQMGRTLIWIRDAEKNKLVVGTQCRILYQDALGRRDIALKFNDMVRKR